MTISERRYRVHELRFKRGVPTRAVSLMLGVHRRTVYEDVKWWRWFYGEVA